MNCVFSFLVWESYSLTITSPQEPAYVALSQSVRQAHCVYSISGAEGGAIFSYTAPELLLQQEPCQSELRLLAVYRWTAAR
jgi:hypothetical protein